ncbi:MAG TPA: NAD(P)/FAD-dependent oxidoreductase [Smithellaceae bacterium]|nr:NAD(P)/FAD-dependent oxidoreductase [Smithellaceae bacterium]
MKTLRISGIKLALEESEDRLPGKITAALKIAEGGLGGLEIIKRAIDARRNKPPHFVYVVKAIVADDVAVPAGSPEGMQVREIADKPSIPQFCKTAPLQYPVVVAGSGPAGLFAAYVLAERGVPVLLLERGAQLEKRIRDVRTFWEEGRLNSSSNVLFGEGGAGTFSDGKLTSRSKNPYSSWVKNIFVAMGAPAAILTDAKPHIGTDRLRQVLINLRNKLTAMGCIIKFEKQITGFVIRHGALCAVEINEREEVKAGQLILAIGQSADDTYGKLWEAGVAMEAKPFAMGLRVEHPQELINVLQYGKWSGHPQLPPAEYFVTAALPHLRRSVYTFCMCPGGEIIGCSASPGLVVTNGMSNSLRSGKFANSAVVVDVRVDDFAGAGEPLAGLVFRGKWEQKAFKAGGGNYCAPVQRLTDFLAEKEAVAVGPTSFLPGTKPFPLAGVLPPFVGAALRAGIAEFNRKMPGFVTGEANLIGVETRTSSPVRICRKSDGRSVNVDGIYPCGEGAGYAGGIISSALDGINAAEHLIANLS